MLHKKTGRSTTDIITDIEHVKSLSSPEHGVHIGGIYLHHKGYRYKVLTVARDTEDLSWNVIYEALYENKVAQIWSRKLEAFLALITLDDGTKQPRFIYQEQAR